MGLQTHASSQTSQEHEILFSDDFQPDLAMKFLVESEFQGQGPPRTQETTKTTGTIRIPRVGFGTDRPYIALFWGPTFRDLPSVEHSGLFAELVRPWRAFRHFCMFSCLDPNTGFPQIQGRRSPPDWVLSWERPKQCFCFVFVLFFVLFLLVLVVLVVVLVLLGVVLV